MHTIYSNVYDLKINEWCMFMLHVRVHNDNGIE